MNNDNHNALKIANFFIDKAKQEKIKDLTCLKLNNLSYIAYGFCLAYDIELFDDKIEAWDNGAVVPVIYHEFKHHIASHIKDYGYITNFQDDIIDKKYIPVFIFNKENKQLQSILDLVWRTYKNNSGLYLKSLTNQNGTPWNKSIITGNKIIYKDLIKKYYYEFITINFKINNICKQCK